MQTWMPELYVHSFHLQNTLSADSYEKRSAPFKSQNMSFLLQESVLSAKGNLAALFHAVTYFT